MSRKVYANADLVLSGTTLDDILEISDFNINVVNNTTPDWEYFGSDWVVNAPTLATFSCTFNTTLDHATGLDLDNIINVQRSFQIFYDDAIIYSGDIALSADVNVSRVDYGKVSWSGKGTLNLNNTS